MSKLGFLSLTLAMLISLGSLKEINRTNSVSKTNATTTVITSSSQSFPNNIHVGAWMWGAPATYEETFLKNFFSSAQTDGINAVYVRVDDYIDIIELYPHGSFSKEAEKFTEDLKTFVSYASQYDIAVYAVAGNEMWANPSHSYIPIELTKYVLDYNEKSSPEERLVGIHFDIESFGLEAFQTASNQEKILLNLVKLTESLVVLVKTRSSDLTIGITVPYWLDGTTRNLPLVQFNNENKQAVFHLIDILSILPATELIIMAYRNEPHGTNGSIELVKEEISYASSTTVSVLVAQETIEYSDEPHATFFGRKKLELINAATELNNAYSGSAFGGISIHDLNGYLLLRE